MIAISGKTRCFFWGATVFDTRAHTYTHTDTWARTHTQYVFEGFEAEKRYFQH
jgi:hypothetical protein